MTLSAEEFIRRFLLHVLPDGFQRIRYYGFLGQSLPRRETGALPPTAGHGRSRKHSFGVTVTRITGTAMKNSPDLPCGSVRSVTGTYGERLSLLPSPTDRTAITDTS